MSTGVKRYCAIDLETTGLDPRSDRIIEFGGIRFDANEREMGRLQLIIDPGMPIHPNASAVNGIFDSDVAGLPKFHEVASCIFNFMKDHIIIAHNSIFDHKFIFSEFQRLKNNNELIHIPGMICTMRLSRERHAIRSHSLANVMRHLGILSSESHRAIADCEAVKLLYMRMNAHLGDESTYWKSPSCIVGIRKEVHNVDGTTYATAPACSELGISRMEDGGSGSPDMRAMPEETDSGRSEE